MSKRKNKKSSVKMLDGSHGNYKTKQSYVKIPASRNFFGRAYAVVKSSIMHPLKATVIEETEDEVKTRTL